MKALARAVRRTTLEPKPKTCRRGHVVSGENVVLERGKRRCRECRRINDAALRMQRQAAAKARKPGMVPCDQCGRKFRPSKTGRRSLTCSERCHGLRDRARRRGEFVEDGGSVRDAEAVEPNRVPLSLSALWLTLAARL